MTNIAISEEHLLQLAHEASTLAETMSDPYAKKLMVVIAAAYVLLARRRSMEGGVQELHDVPDKLKH